MSKVITEKAPSFTPDATDSHRGKFAAKTILLNDDWHTFGEVASQLMKAVRCSYSEGLAIANVVHHTGSAVVYSGPFERCEAVAMVLEGIALRVKVER
jgi:ATP-dependent Clp protease adapter protein ClpS